MLFEIKDEEFLKYKEFREKHKCCDFTCSIGGKLSFIFTPTSLGWLTEVRCNKCGEQQDITIWDD